MHFTWLRQAGRCWSGAGLALAWKVRWVWQVLAESRGCRLGERGGARQAGR